MSACVLGRLPSGTYACVLFTKQHSTFGISAAVRSLVMVRRAWISLPQASSHPCMDALLQGPHGTSEFSTHPRHLHLPRGGDCPSAMTSPPSHLRGVRGIKCL